MKTSINIFSLLLLLMMAISCQTQTSTGGKQQAAAIPSSAEAVNPLKKGSKIPIVNLVTPEGDSFNLNSFVKEQPVVLIFYRGGWCPYCNVHLKELMEADPQLRAMGYQILAVSPDTPEKLSESMEEHEMTYRLLSDSTMEAAKAFGVAFQVAESTAKKYKAHGIDLVEGTNEDQHLLPVPSVFIIDPQETIRYVYYNPDYQTRIKVDELLQQAKKAK